MAITMSPETLLATETTLAEPPAPPPVAREVPARVPSSDHADLSIPTPRQGIARGWGLLLALAWPAVVAVCTAVEPTPAPDPLPALLVVFATVTYLVLLAGMMATFVTAVGRRPAIGNASTVAAAAAIVATVSCPLSGHHEGIGAWWAVQMVLSVGMLVVSRLVARRIASGGKVVAPLA